MAGEPHGAPRQGPGGPPRAAVTVLASLCEPGSAASVVTYVPGLGSKITGALGDSSSRAAVLWRQAHRFDPTAQTASIYWLNYNAPQLSPSSLFSPQSVALPDDAQAAAPTLDRFAAGLAAVPDRGAKLKDFG